MECCSAQYRRAVLAALVASRSWPSGWCGASPAPWPSSESPSPAAGKIILRLGWTNDPDNLNPFIGYESSVYEIWALNYELLVGFRAKDYANVPGVGLATELADVRRRQGLDVHDHRQGRSGRTACR